MRRCGMFTEREREALRAQLTGFAQADARVVAAASLGSAVRGELDRWSDIDLALRLAPGVEVDAVVKAWTERVGQSELVVDHLDLHASGARYRVLLLASTLHSAVRMRWLYALHLRSALGRGRWWQASWMLQSIRDVVVGLYCQRLDLPQGEGRGVDRLPAELLEGLVRTHPSRVESEQLSASFEVVMDLLLEEAERHGVHVSADLAGVVVELARHEHGSRS